MWLDLTLPCLSQLRLPPGTNDDVDEDPTGNKALWDRGLLGGASQKADVLCQFHIGETALSLQVSTAEEQALVTADCLLISTL